MSITDLAIEAAGLCLRFLPWGSREGLMPVGRPDGDSPVLLTGNYIVTVRRVRRALRGLDAWLLSADSGGINVWCASSGGHLTNRDVIEILRGSGIGERVKHRKLILPALSAPGLEPGGYPYP